jgi:uncharacterized OsmC-like protein
VASSETAARDATPAVAGPLGDEAGRSAVAGPRPVRRATARLIGETAAVVTIQRGSRGPWSVVVDEPIAGRVALGPPPGYLALIGIGSCTIVTVAGVASRGESALDGMQVSFEVAAGTTGSEAGGLGVDIRQRTTLEADLTERDRDRLGRAISHCPVGKNFTKRGVTIEDVVVLNGAAGTAPAGTPALPRPSAALSFPPGRVNVDFLPATREWRLDGGRPVLDQEGGVAAYATTGAAPDEQRHWGFLGGHTTAGWAPRPSGYAIAGLAASTLLTVRRLAEQLAVDPASLEVAVEVVSDVPTGGKEASQELAAGGVAGGVRWRRTVRAVAIGPLAAEARLAEAMRLDPVFGACERGDLLAGEEVVVRSPGTPTPA